MKLIKTLVATSFLVAAASASAMTVDQTTSSTNINLTVEDGVATLFGHVDSNFERVQAAAEAAKIDGVDQVRNLLTFSN